MIAASGTVAVGQLAFYSVNHIAVGIVLVIMVVGINRNLGSAIKRTAK